MLLMGVIYLIIDTYLLYYPYVQMNLFVIYYLIAYVNSLIHIFFFMSSEICKDYIEY